MTIIADTSYLFALYNSKVTPTTYASAACDDLTAAS